MKNKAFWLISSLGILIRCVVAIAFPTRAWIDEIWVVLDPAFRLLTGVGPVERDWAWQVRDHIPPTLLFLYFNFLQLLGISDGLFIQASVRFFISLATGISILFFLLMLARIFKLKNLPWISALVCFFIPDFVHYAATADLSVLGIPPLLVGLTLLFWSAEELVPTFKTRLGSVLIVFASLIRFQFGIFPAVLFFGFLATKKFKISLELAAIGVGFILLDIVFNSLMYGNFVFPMINYFLVNTTGGVASRYGVTPFYFAFELLWKFMTEPVFMLSLLFAWFSYKKTPALTISIFLFFLLHALVAHKEYRFFYGAALTMAALGSISFESFLEQGNKKWFTSTFLVLFLLVGSFRAVKKTDFKAYMIPAKLEALAGRDPSLKGIITFGWGGIYQGCNYTVFKPIPCIFVEQKAHLKSKNIDVEKFSHLVTGSEEPAPCANKLASEYGGTLYQCTKEELAKLLE